MAQKIEDKSKKPRDLWQELCSISNLTLAFRKARKHKTLKPYVIEFEKNLSSNLESLRIELLLHSYRPKPLEIFIIRDPKTRKISKSDFRDRIVHHAICNIIEPFFEKTFIYDNYANRKSKGVLKALDRFDYFKRKVSKNNSKICFVLKADIRHYFDAVDHGILISILNHRIKDKRIIWLIKLILANHKTKIRGKGMPLGNLTSQFFANVYLNELDCYVKKVLKIKFYIRYVDDFVIFGDNKIELLDYKKNVGEFLKRLLLELHPEKSNIIKLDEGVCFLGIRNFYYYQLLKKRNLHKFHKKLLNTNLKFLSGTCGYDKAYDLFEGWLAYAKTSDTYNLRKLMIFQFEKLFSNKISDKEINRWLKIKS